MYHAWDASGAPSGSRSTGSGAGPPPACVTLQCNYNVFVRADLRFEWNPEKDRSNRRKHGVTFDEARTAFMDEHGRLMHDPDNSDVEDRFVLLGLSLAGRLLVVCHSYRSDDEIIRIFSARKANRKERATYAQWWKP